MTAERTIKTSVAYVRGELARLIAIESSTFRARLFEQELTRLDALAADYAERPTRFCRKGLAEVMLTVAVFTLDSLEMIIEAEAVLTFNQAETMKRLDLIFAAARALQQ